MLPNTLQCTGQPSHNKELSSIKMPIQCAKVRNLGPEGQYVTCSLTLSLQPLHSPFGSLAAGGRMEPPWKFSQVLHLVEKYRKVAFIQVPHDKCILPEEEILGAPP